MASAIRFYLDENVEIVVADQLRLRNIEVATVRDLGLQGDIDSNHLQRATQMGCVLCTHDYDFVALAASGIDHAGIVIGKMDKHTIGDWVRWLTLIHATLTPEEMQNFVEYLP